MLLIIRAGRKIFGALNKSIKLCYFNYLNVFILAFFLKDYSCIFCCKRFIHNQGSFNRIIKMSFFFKKEYQSELKKNIYIILTTK